MSTARDISPRKQVNCLDATSFGNVFRAAQRAPHTVYHEGSLISEDCSSQPAEVLGWIQTGNPRINSCDVWESLLQVKSKGGEILYGQFAYIDDKAYENRLHTYPDTKEIIYFSSKSPTHSEFSNFWAAEFDLDGVHQYNAEQAFQAIKAITFHDENALKKILAAKTPASAKALGRTVQKFNESVWTSRKVDTMRCILRAKFTQNPELREKLLSTGTAILAEGTRDSQWGIMVAKKGALEGAIHVWGKNILGKLLMELRSEFQLGQERTGLFLSANIGELIENKLSDYHYKRQMDMTEPAEVFTPSLVNSRFDI